MEGGLLPREVPVSLTGIQGALVPEYFTVSTQGRSERPFLRRSTLCCQERGLPFRGKRGKEPFQPPLPKERRKGFTVADNGRGALGGLLVRKGTDILTFIFMKKGFFAVF